MKKYKYNYFLLSSVVIVPGVAQFAGNVDMQLTDHDDYKIKSISLANNTTQRGAGVFLNDDCSLQITGVNMWQLPNPQFSSTQLYVGFNKNNQVMFAGGLSPQAAINFQAFVIANAGFLAGDTISVNILIEWEYDAK